ncbi:DUF29 family protein [Picosynechococcus sp. PCC 11901]|uniref:DUF29 family protein n=1 Tax=Picosynechococcus sp. PCC 11901 TaxID=2579791 RepID=UPI00210595FE|nr:DUF29 family protein [Picosynechococcus sp. PCC 11901]
MSSSLYDTDFYTWTAQQCELLRHKKFHELDLSHLIEELDDLGKRHYDQLESRIKVSTIDCPSPQMANTALATF